MGQDCARSPSVPEATSFCLSSDDPEGLVPTLLCLGVKGREEFEALCPGPAVPRSHSLSLHQPTCVFKEDGGVARSGEQQQSQRQGQQAGARHSCGLSRLQVRAQVGSTWPTRGPCRRTAGMAGCPGLWGCLQPFLPGTPAPPQHWAELCS